MDGVLVAAKPAGPTSHDVVALVRRLAGTRRVGHGGTLDPFASGVLPLFLGRATRLAEYHLGATKRYRATVCFGASSTTDDLEGELTPVDGTAPGRDLVAAALEGFTGPIVQTPPAYSAVKVSGRRAYALARAGQSPEIEPREVTIHRLDLVDWFADDPERPIAILELECSAGTYVRALARDLGRAVGSAAYLGALVRTASGPFTLEGARDLDAIRAAAADDQLSALLLPIDAGLEAFPSIRVDARALAALSRGQFVRPAGGVPLPGDRPIRVLGPDDRLVAIATVRAGRLAPDKVLVDIVDSPAGPVIRDEDAEIEAAAAAERDPSLDIDSDPVTPDA